MAVGQDASGYLSAANPALFNLGMPSANIWNPTTRVLYAAKRF